MKLIRPLKDGGMSECSCPDDLVGTRRCQHIFTEEGKGIGISKVDRGLYEVEVEDSGNLTINGQEEAISKFFASMPKIDKETQDKIISFIEGE